MADLTISKRYAKALFDFSLEENKVEEVKNDMEFVANTCRDSRELKSFLKSPIIKTGKKLLVMKKLFENKISEISLRYILIITRKGREDYLESICNSFIDIYKVFKNILPVTLETAVEINEELKKKVIDLLHEHTQSKIELTDKIREELIGGFILAYSDYQYDASVKNQLNRLQRRSARFNLYERKI